MYRRLNATKAQNAAIPGESCQREASWGPMAEFRALGEGRRRRLRMPMTQAAPRISVATQWKSRTKISPARFLTMRELNPKQFHPFESNQGPRCRAQRFPLRAMR